MASARSPRSRTMLLLALYVHPPSRTPSPLPLPLLSSSPTANNPSSLAVKFAEDIARKHGHHECAKLIMDTRERIAKRDARLAREAAAEEERIRRDKELEDELRRIGLAD